MAAGLAAALALTLALASASKARAPWRFTGVLRGYRVPRALRPLVAHVVILIEAGLATALLHPSTRRPALVGTVMLMVLFLVAQATVLVRGSRAPCGCIGLDAAETYVGARSMARASVCLIVALVATVAPTAAAADWTLICGIAAAVVLVAEQLQRRIASWATTDFSSSPVTADGTHD